jgi:hypothetical protein
MAEEAREGGRREEGGRRKEEGRRQDWERVPQTDKTAQLGYYQPTTVLDATLDK